MQLWGIPHMYLKTITPEQYCRLTDQTYAQYVEYVRQMNHFVSFQNNGAQLWTIVSEEQYNAS